MSAGKGDPSRAEIGPASPSPVPGLPGAGLTQSTGRAAADLLPPDSEPPVSLWRGLSGRLLVLTVLFVCLAEIVVFLPSIANFRNMWLQSHLDRAEAAGIVYLDAGARLSAPAQDKLLIATGALAVVVREDGMARLMAASEVPAEVDRAYDMTRLDPIESMLDALAMLIPDRTTTYRVFGPMHSRDAVIELVQTDDGLRQALRVYARNVALLTLAISAITSALVFLALYWLTVRPIRRFSRAMRRFAAAPDDASRILEPHRRLDEIGQAERALALLQRHLHDTLRQRQHLAELGLAVSKINHDLRNILASAQLFTDRILQLPDPTVQRVAPKLLRAIDRAADYTRSVLDYGRAVERPPQPGAARLRRLAEEAFELVSPEGSAGAVLDNRLPDDLVARADGEQVVRVLTNLMRNAVQAMERQRAEAGALAGERLPPGRLTVAGGRLGESIWMTLADNGPGIPSSRQECLFRPFGNSASPGGTGLGLAIAAELTRANGGEVSLQRSEPTGTTFRLTLPAMPGLRAVV